MSIALCRDRMWVAPFFFILLLYYNTLKKEEDELKKKKKKKKTVLLPLFQYKKRLFYCIIFVPTFIQMSQSTATQFPVHLSAQQKLAASAGNERM